MPGPHRVPYPPEFRAEAVKAVRGGEAPIARVARDPGVNAEPLWLWVRQADVDDGHRDGLTTEERAELARLREDVRILDDSVLPRGNVAERREEVVRLA